MNKTHLKIAYVHGSAEWESAIGENIETEDDALIIKDVKESGIDGGWMVIVGNNGRRYAIPPHNVLAVEQIIVDKDGKDVSAKQQEGA